MNGQIEKHVCNISPQKIREIEDHIEKNAKKAWIQTRNGLIQQYRYEDN